MTNRLIWTLAVLLTLAATISAQSCGQDQHGIACTNITQAGVPSAFTLISPTNATLTYFAFPDAPASVAYITLQVNAVQGLPVLYVSYVPFIGQKTFPTPTSYDYTTADSLEFPNIYIRTSTSAQSGSGQWIVGVFASNGSPANVTVVYNLFAANLSSLSVYQLTDGVKAFGAELAFMAVQYSYTPIAGDAAIFIAITSFYGDAEVFVSKSYPVTNDSFIWRSYDAGTQVIVINSTDPNWCGTCTYYIAAYPHEESAYYQLVAGQSNANANTSIQVFAGQAVNYAAQAYSYSQFIYAPEQWDRNMEVRIAATPAYGPVHILLRKASKTSAYVWPTPSTLTSNDGVGYGAFDGSGLHVHKTDGLLV